MVILISSLIKLSNYGNITYDPETDIASTSIFKTGTEAVVSIFGVVLMSNTFINAHSAFHVLIKLLYLLLVFEVSAA